MFADYKVRIEGHSDSSGGTEVNLRLTQRRADAFMKYLAEEVRCPLGAADRSRFGRGSSYCR